VALVCPVADGVQGLAVPWLVAVAEHLKGLRAPVIVLAVVSLVSFIAGYFACLVFQAFADDPRRRGYVDLTGWDKIGQDR
jgi:hypothetical protein